MNWAEWCAYAESAPATPAQVGAIHGEWRRLWPGCGRETRLSTCAALLGRGELGSTTDLVLGDAGRLLGMLRGFASRTDLAAAVALSDEEKRAAEPTAGGLAGDGVRLADALVPVMTAVVAVWQGWRSRRGRPRGELGAPGRRGDRTGPINASLKARPGTRPPARATEPSTRNQAWRRRRGESSCNACNSLQRLARALTWAFNAVATACNALSWR